MEFQFRDRTSISKLSFNFRIKHRFQDRALILKNSNFNIKINTEARFLHVSLVR